MILCLTSSVSYTEKEEENEPAQHYIVSMVDAQARATLYRARFIPPSAAAGEEVCRASVAQVETKSPCERAHVLGCVAGRRRRDLSQTHGKTC